MGNKQLLVNLIIVNLMLFAALLLCLLLGLYLGPATASAPLIDQSVSEEPTASDTPLPNATPTMTLTPTPSSTPTHTATPTPYPTMHMVTPLPSVEIIEPTRVPYVFPTPINIPGQVPAVSPTTLPAQVPYVFPTPISIPR